MKIQSLIKRKNGSKILLGSTTYEFKPDAEGNHVCEVTDKAHIQRLLAITEGYVEHGKQPKAKEVKAEKAPEVELNGTAWEPVEVEYEGGKVTTAELVKGAFKASGLTPEAWNELSKEDVEGLLAAELEVVKAKPTGQLTKQEKKESLAAEKSKLGQR
jgi:hypothetical protein